MTHTARFYSSPKIIFLIVLFLCSKNGYAQRFNYSPDLGSGGISQLKAKLAKAKDDTNKVYMLNDLLELYLSESLADKALQSGYQSLKLARKLHFDKGIAITFTNIGHAYSYNVDNDNALKMYLNALHMNRKLKRESAITDTYINIGTIYDDMSNYSEALHYYTMALKRTPKNDHEVLADIHQNLGITFGALGDQNEALNHYFKALDSYEKLHDKSGVADVYNSMGNVYAEKKDFKSGLDMYYASLKLYKEAEDEFGIANEYVNLGILYAENNELKKAQFFYSKALKRFNDLDDIEGQVITYNSLGKAYYLSGKLEQSESAFTTGLEKATSVEDSIEMTNAKTGLAYVYADRNNLKKARQYALEAVATNASLHNKLSIRDGYAALLYVEKKAKNFEKAFEYQEKFIAYKDSINNEETTKKGIRIALNYSFQKKANAEQRKHERTVSKLNLTNQNNKYFIIVLILIICSALVVAFFARRAYYNRKRYSEVLANENTHKEMLLQEIHHRVNNSLQMISSLLSIQADSTGNEEIREYLLKSENRLQAMSVMHQLLHLGNSKLEVDMNTYFGEVLSFYSNLLESRQNVKLHVNVPSVLFHTKTAMPLALILNELITNSLKYAFPDDKGEIHVSLQQVDDSSEWIFTVSDDGVGFDENNVPSDSGSLGLSLVNLMTRQIDGKLEVDASKGTSTKVRFTRKDK